MDTGNQTPKQSLDGMIGGGAPPENKSQTSDVQAVNNTAPEPAPTHPEGQAAEPTNPPTKKRKKGLVIGLILIIAGLAIAATAAFLLPGGVSNEKTDVSDAPKVSKKTIPLLKVATTDRVMEFIYPDIKANEGVPQYFSITSSNHLLGLKTNQK